MMHRSEIRGDFEMSQLYIVYPVLCNLTRDIFLCLLFDQSLLYLILMLFLDTARASLLTRM